MLRFLLVVATLAFCSGCEKDTPSQETGATSAGVVSAPSAPSAKPPPPRLTFEGKAELEVQRAGEDEPLRASLWMKDDKIRVDVTSPEGDPIASRVVDTKDHRAWARGPESDEVETVDYQSQLDALRPLLPEADTKDLDPKVQRTTRMAKIRGALCRFWDYSYPNGEKGTVCLSPIGVDWYHPSVGKKIEWLERVIAGTRFPLRYEHFDPEGKLVTRSEAVAVNKAEVPDEVFDLASGAPKPDAAKPPDE